MQKVRAITGRKLHIALSGPELRTWVKRCAGRRPSARRGLLDIGQAQSTQSFRATWVTLIWALLLLRMDMMRSAAATMHADTSFNAYAGKIWLLVAAAMI